MLEALYESPLIGSIAESSELKGSIAADIANSEYTDSVDELSLLGINRTECLEELSEEDIVWEQGTDWASFQESDGVCIISQTFAEEARAAIGDTLKFNVARYSQGLAGVTLTREELLNETFRVVGIYKEMAGREGGNPEILLPLDAVKNIYEKNDKVYFASALSFEITDPMSLNEAKKELTDAGLKEIIYGSPRSYVGIGVKLTDSVFIRSMESADRSLKLLKSFLPFIFLIVVAAGYIIPSLFITGQRERITIERLLGRTKRQCAISVLSGMMLLSAAGCMAGSTAGWIASGKASENLGETLEFDRTFSDNQIVYEEPEEEEEAPGPELPCMTGTVLMIVSVVISTGYMAKTLRKEPVRMLGEIEE